MTITKLPARLKPLFNLAKKVRLNSHSPYSRCKVGAAIRLTNGEIFTGCNVENSSYGATVCAERGAIQTAVAARGKIKIAEILVVTDASPPWLPCALCRQVISEFAASAPGGDIPVHSTNVLGETISTSFKALYPGLFSGKELREGQKPEK